MSGHGSQDSTFSQQGIRIERHIPVPDVENDSNTTNVASRAGIARAKMVMVTLVGKVQKLLSLDELCDKCETSRLEKRVSLQGSKCDSSH